MFSLTTYCTPDSFPYGNLCPVSTPDSAHHPGKTCCRNWRHWTSSGVFYDYQCSPAAVGHFSCPCSLSAKLRACLPGLCIFQVICIYPDFLTVQGLPKDLGGCPDPHCETEPSDTPVRECWFSSTWMSPGHKSTEPLSLRWTLLLGWDKSTQRTIQLPSLALSTQAHTSHAAGSYLCCC